MMSSLAFTFVFLPCIGSVAVAAALRDWRLAMAVLCGALALAFLAPAIGGYGLMVMPLAVGAALGALVTAISLYRSPDVDLWARMFRALLVAFVASFFNLITFAGGA